MGNLATAMDATQANRSKMFTFMFVVIFTIVLFSMGVIRSRCISQGYELSRLASDIEQRRISIERIDMERSAMVSKERLFQLAKERGFVMMSEGKTFNVQ